MSDNKEIARKLFEEGWSNSRYEVFDELCDKDKYTGHDPLRGDLTIDGLKQSARDYRAAFGDMKMSVLACFGEGDLVTTCWQAQGHHTGTLMGAPGSGREVKVDGISVARISGGKIVEEWT